jgi:hypothetical protein
MKCFAKRKIENSETFPKIIKHLATYILQTKGKSHEISAEISAKICGKFAEKMFLYKGHNVLKSEEIKMHFLSYCFL